jgi:N-acetyl-D-muramate 6-phosphate phosphatase
MGLEPTRIRAILFDVDGTLSDTDDQWTERLASALRPVKWLFPGRNVTAAARWLILSMETPGNLAYTFLDWTHLDGLLAHIYNFFAKRKKSRRANHYRLIPGVKETLIRLSQNYPMAVVSARDVHSTHVFLKQYDLEKLFQAIATSQTCEYTKPYPDPLLWAAGMMNVAPEECLMIGDTTVDIRAGKAAGAQTVGVLCGFGDEAELRRAGTDLILSSTADLADVLLGPVKN